MLGTTVCSHTEGVFFDARKIGRNSLLQVRCLVDHGEFETQDGNIIVLKKNSQVGDN